MQPETSGQLLAVPIGQPQGRLPRQAGQYTENAWFNNLPHIQGALRVYAFQTVEVQRKRIKFGGFF